MDNGTSFHIKADFSHLHNPLHSHVELTVGGGRVMQAMHQGTVWLDLEVTRTVISIPLFDVLYLPDWKQAYLISWRKIDELGCFSMIGEDAAIEIKKKIYDSVVISIPFMHGSYLVILIVQYGRIYMATINFWHKPLRYYYTHFWSITANIS